MSTKRKLLLEEIEDILSVIHVNEDKEWLYQSVKNSKEVVRRQLEQVEIYPEIIPKLKDEIMKQYYRSQLQPGEMVGVLAASSIGEQNTQASLNSVVGETKILVMIDGKAQQTTIGELIDNSCNTQGFETVEYGGKNETEEKAYAEVVKINSGWKIQSIDEHGKVDWRQITKLIRHPLYTKLIKVTTESGKYVTATTGLSFLIKNDQGLIVPIEGSDLKVGDRIPIGYKNNRIICNTVSLRDYLSPKDYIYGSELYKARQYREKYSNKEICRPKNYKSVGKNPAWWTLHNNVDFVLPISRSDSAMFLLEGYKGANKGNEFFKENCIYIKGQSSDSHIPESIELDELFGFFIGIYLSEGCVTEQYISISNYDKNVLNKVKMLCTKWNIGYHYVQIGYKYKIMNKYEESKNRIVTAHAKEMENSEDPCEIRLHNKLLSTWIKSICGKGSENKHIPNFAFNAPTEFIKGMLDGLFSGDGTFYSTSSDYSSCSETLIQGIVTILSFFSITCTTHSNQAKYNNKSSKVIQKTYSLSITQTNNKRFGELVGTLTETNKAKKLQELKERSYTHEVFWSRVKDKNPVKKSRRITEPEGNYVKSGEDVFMDAIVSIEYVDTTNVKYVYDFEVPSTGNFCLLNQMHVRDSFHTSGAFKANLTGGLARLNELMNATENLKTPSLTIYFNKDVEQSLQNIRKICFSKLIFVQVEDIVDNISIDFNPTLDPWYDIFNIISSQDYRSCSCRARLFLNTQKLWRHQISMRTIVAKINSKIDTKDKLYFAYSHDSMGILDLWVNDNIPNFSTVLNIKDVSKIIGISETDSQIYLKHYINKVVLPNIFEVQLSGIEGLKDCYYTEVKREWRVDTNGGKLKQLLSVSCVDGNRCRSNDIHEIFHLFGIEAVKQFLRDEYSSLVKVNPRHLELLIDSMTVSGGIQRVTRNGIDRKQVGTIAKASFEQPVDNFLISATFGEVDPLKGVSAAITVGKVAQIGTGFMSLHLDTSKLNTVQSFTKRDEALDNIEIEIEDGDQEEEEQEIIEEVEELMECEE